MDKRHLLAAAIAATFTAGGALAAPPDWSKVPAKKITVFSICPVSSSVATSLAKMSFISTMQSL